MSSSSSLSWAKCACSMMANDSRLSSKSPTIVRLKEMRDRQVFVGSSCPHSSRMTLCVTVCPCFCPHQTFLYKCYPQFSFVQFSCSVVSDSLPPHGLQYGQASLSITNSQSLLKLVSIESVMPSNHLILCCPFFLLSSIFPSIKVFSS